MNNSRMTHDSRYDPEVHHSFWTRLPRMSGSPPTDDLLWVVSLTKTFHGRTYETTYHNRVSVVEIPTDAFQGC